MNKQLSRRNLVTLANSTELATRAILKTLGRDCAQTSNGQKLTRQVISDAVVAKLGTHINDSIRG